MPENIRNIIYRFSQELRRILGDKLTKIIVYGSYARGDFRENSDIDIMILVKMSDEEIRLVKNDIYDLAFEFEINTGIEFSPIIKNEDQYEYWIDTLPFYRNVRDEGVVMDDTSTKARNIRAVLLTALYNSVNTINSYYGNRYHFHLAEETRREMEETD